MRRWLTVLSLILCSFFALPVKAQFTFVELNCENIFDTTHDEGKDDSEYLPDAIRRWTKRRYWRKLNNIAQELLSTCDDRIPDLIALCEVENDTVMRDLTARSLLRNANYGYVMTSSPDRRGVDVALLYSHYTFMPIRHHSIAIEPVKGMRPTRDILYVAGQLVCGDTLHVFVVHAPSRFGGERFSRPFREAVAGRLCDAIDSVYAASADARILVAGDFNEDADGSVMQRICQQHRIRNLTKDASSVNGVKGTYRYKGKWESIDHILGSRAMHIAVDSVYIHAPQFLLEEDKDYGGYHPRRTYNGMRYQPGYSDHLPLVARFRL